MNNMNDQNRFASAWNYVTEEIKNEKEKYDL